MLVFMQCKKSIKYINLPESQHNKSYHRPATFTEYSENSFITISNLIRTNLRVDNNYNKYKFSKFCATNAKINQLKILSNLIF